MADLGHYLCELVSNWAALFSAVMLIPDGLGLVLRKKHIEWLDSVMGGEEWRVFIFRSLFVIGLFIAGFLAWSKQYEVAAKYPDAVNQNAALREANLDLQTENEKLRGGAVAMQTELLELRSHKPRIRADIMSDPFLVSSQDPDHRTTILVLMRVVNQGSSPASIRDFSLIVETAGETFTFEHHRMPDPGSDSATDRALLDFVRSIQLSDVKLTNQSLWDQVSHSMPQGEPVVGFLRFSRAEDIYAKLAKTSGTIRVSFTDSQDQPSDAPRHYSGFLSGGVGLSCPAM